MKKLKLTLILIFTTINIISFNSCEKIQDNSNNNDKYNDKTHKNSINNPYDFYGEWHNNYLNYLTNSTMDPTLSNYKELLFNFGCNFSENGIDANLLSYSEYLNIENEIDNALIYEQTDDVIDYICMSLDQIPEIHPYIDDLYRNILFSSTVFNTECCTPIQFNCLVDDLIQTIIDENGGIDAIENNSSIACMLSVCSVAQHSYEYWYNYYIVEENNNWEYGIWPDPDKHPKLYAFCEKVKNIADRVWKDVTGFVMEIPSATHIESTPIPAVYCNIGKCINAGAESSGLN